MLMLLLVAVLIAMMGFALVRHWKVQNGKNTVASPHPPSPSLISFFVDDSLTALFSPPALHKLSRNAGSWITCYQMQYTFPLLFSAAIPGHFPGGRRRDNGQRASVDLSAN
ncbi:hypothetical protein VRC13_12005 [Erwinia aphidicola]|uniref:hypothetical protein n=1 Tax=Erwinia aphidicola TaxID=68334 RepID=UPI0030CB2796